jgi:hypothetical protein
LIEIIPVSISKIVNAPKFSILLIHGLRCRTAQSTIAVGHFFVAAANLKIAQFWNNNIYGEPKKAFTFVGYFSEHNGLLAGTGCSIPDTGKNRRTGQQRR